MFRIPGGWEVEPLVWLALVWWILVSTAHGLWQRNPRLSLAQLGFCTTLIPIIVLFPFSGISLTYERARFINTQREVPRPFSRPNQFDVWGWHRLPDGRLIPNCLFWRICVEGQKLPFQSKPRFPFGRYKECHLNEQQLSRMRLSPALLDEVRSIGLSCRPRIPLDEEGMRILSHNIPNLRNLSRIYLLGESNSPVPSFPLENLPLQPKLEVLHIWSSQTISCEALRNFFASNQLRYVTLGYCDIPDSDLAGLRLLGDKLHLDVSNSRILRETIVDITSEAASVGSITINENQFSLDLLQAVRDGGGDLQIAESR
jgi:hypothetical protein